MRERELAVEAGMSFEVHDALAVVVCSNYH